jgi:hypothetical protein
MSSGLYKAVCYRCSHVGPVSANHCPRCHFPLILEPEGTPPGGRQIHEIFDRGSVADGAPPLPGVHAEKRKAQLMAEARRDRIATTRQPRAERERDHERDHEDASHLSPFTADDPASVRIPRFRHGTLKLTLFCASAIAAGVLAAALQSGAL